MKKMYFAVVLLASLLAGACSSDSSSKTTYTETAQSEAPKWQMDWTYDQERPTWDEPAMYGSFTLLNVRIEDQLQPYVGENDLMGVFVNDELCGLAGPNLDLETGELAGDGKFQIKVWGDDPGTATVRISLRYYCEKLKHLFTLSEDIKLDPDTEIGYNGTPYVPPFTSGSAKYPFVRTVALENTLKKAGLTPAAGSITGAFVGNECRGTVTLSDTGSTLLTVYGRSEGESVTLKYYDEAKGVLYTIDNALNI